MGPPLPDDDSHPLSRASNGLSLPNNSFIGRLIEVILIARQTGKHNEVASRLDVRDDVVVDLALIARSVDDGRLAEPFLRKRQDDPTADAELPRFLQSDNVSPQAAEHMIVPMC
jgi:hypothetical protein